MNESRTANSIRNSLFGLVSQAFVIILNFISRKVFILFLNVEYLGINGLFSNILSILSLAELGVGSAIVYSMYKPINEKKIEKVSALMNLYGKLYRVIGCVIAICGVALVPFLQHLIKDQPQIAHLNLIYLLFLLNTVVSYFFAYKRSIITADQKDYILSKYRIYFNIGKTIVQIIGIVLMKNFFVYLIIQIIFTLAENIKVSTIADKMYPFLKKRRKEKLPYDETKQIFRNVGALMIYKVATVFLGGIDNLIISSMIGVVAVAMYSNYTLVTNSLSNVLTIITGAITASLGQFVASESNRRKEELLDVLIFVHYIFYGISAVCLFGLLNPFIELYLGRDYLFPMEVTAMIAANFYVWGMMNPFWMYRSTMGLFVEGKWRPVVSALINFGLSILLGKVWGVFGVIFATLIARMTTNWWFDPYIIYKKGLGISPIPYLVRWLKYTAVIVVTSFCVYVIQQFMGQVTIWKFCVLVMLSVLIPLIAIILIYHKKKEFQYLKKNIRRLMFKR